MDITVKRIINSPIDSNSYVIYHKKNNKCIIVDPGTCDCRELIRFLYDKRLIPLFIILTHEHFDHIWGVNRLKNIFKCDIICSMECGEAIIKRKKNMSVFYDQIGFETYPPDILIENLNFRLEFNDIIYEFIESKGHTNGSVCILVESKLFTGDTIILKSKTVTKFPGGNKEKLRKTLDSISSMIYGKEIVFYPGHGQSFSINEFDIKECL